MHVETERRRNPKVFHLVNDTWGVFKESEFTLGIQEIVRRTPEPRRNILLDLARMGFLPLIAIRSLSLLVQHVRSGSGKGRLALLGIPHDLASVVESDTPEGAVRAFTSSAAAYAFFGVEPSSPKPPAPKSRPRKAAKSPRPKRKR
ncbi:MAG: hypothetical protein AAB215_05680 [Planctomycetota bacterium]